jgi:hypothetical protein
VFSRRSRGYRAPAWRGVLAVLFGIVATVLFVGSPALAVGPSDGDYPTAPVITTPAVDDSWVIGWAGGGTTLSWTPSTDSSGIREYRLEDRPGYVQVIPGDATSVDVNIGAAARGEVSTWRLWAVDNAGNVSDVATRTVIAETVQPGPPTDLTVATTAGSTTVHVTWQPPAHDNSVVRWRIYYDGDWQHAVDLDAATLSDTVTLAPQPGSDAPRSVMLQGFDSHDLPGVNASRLFYLDTTPPSAPVITSPVNGVWLKHGPLTYTFTPSRDDDTGVLQHQVYVDGTYVEWLSGSNPGPVVARTVTSTGTWEVDAIRGTVPGLHTLQLRAAHRAGFTPVPSNTLTYGIDPTPPSTPTVVVPSSGYAGPTIVSWSRPSDALSGVSAVTLTVDGLASSRSPSARSATLALGPGRHVVSLMVRDKAGNQSTSAVKATTLIARTRPTPVAITAPGSRQLTTRSVRLAWRAGAASWGARIVTYRITLNGRPFAVTGAAQTSLSATVRPGVKTFSVIAVDSAGKQSLPSTVTITAR